MANRVFRTISLVSAIVLAAGGTLTLGVPSAAGAVSESSSLHLSSSQVCAGGEVQAEVTIVDSFSNPVAGVDVTFVADGYAQLGDAQVVTGTDGTASTTLTDDRAEQVSVRATVDGEEVSGSPQSVTFLAGCGTTTSPDPDPQASPGPQVTSQLTVSEDRVCAGESTSVTATAVDGYGNPVAGVDVVFTVDGHATVDKGQVTTGSDGIATATVSDDAAEIVAVHATVDGTDIGGSPQSVTFLAGCGATTPPDSQLPVLELAPFGGKSFVAANGGDDWTGTLAIPSSFSYDPDQLHVVLSDPRARTYKLNDRGNGVFAVAVDSLTPIDDCTVQVYLNDGVSDKPFSNPVHVSFVEAPTFTLTPTFGGSSVLANGMDSWTGTLVVPKDYPESFTLDKIYAAGFDPAVSATPFTQVGDGVYQATFTSTKTTHGDHVWVYQDAEPIYIPFSNEVTMSFDELPVLSAETLWGYASVAWTGGDDWMLSLPIPDGYSTDQLRVVISDPNVRLYDGPFQMTDGEYTWRVVAATAVKDSTVQIYVDDRPISTVAHVSFLPSPVFTVVPTSGDDHVVADGVDSWAGTIAIPDNLDYPFATDQLSISTSNPAVNVSPITEVSDGVFQVTFTSSSPVNNDSAWLTLNDGGIAKIFSNMVVMSFAPEAPIFSAELTSIPVCSDKTRTLIATVHDQYGQPGEGIPLKFSVSQDAWLLDGDTHVLSMTATTDAQGRASVVVGTDAVGYITATVQGTGTYVTPAINMLEFPYGLCEEGNVKVSFETHPTDSGTPVMADGLDTWTGVATVQDLSGQALAGVDLRPNVPDEVTVSDVTDNTDGTYTMTFTSSAPGFYPVSLKYGQNTESELSTIFFSSSPSVDLSRSRLDWGFSTCSGTELVETVFATAIDQNWNYLSGLPVHFSIVGDHPYASLTATDVTTNSNGEGVTQLISTDGKAVEVVAMINGFQVGSRIVYFNVPDCYSGNISFTSLKTVSGNDYPIADGKDAWIVTFAATTPAGMPVPELDPIWMGAFSSSSNVYVSPITNNGDGTYSVRISSWTASSDYTLQIMYLEQMRSDKVYTPFVTVPEKQVLTVDVSATPDSLPRTTSTWVDVTVTDSFGNPVPLVDGEFSWTGSAEAKNTPTSETVYPKNFTTDANGKARIPLLDMTAETVTVTASVGDASASTDVTFTELPSPDGKYSTVVAYPAKYQSILEARVYDRYGNGLPSQDVVFTAPDGYTISASPCTPEQCVGEASLQVTTDASGLAQAYVGLSSTDRVSIHAAVMVDGVPVEFRQSPLTVWAQNADIPSLKLSTLTIKDPTVLIGCDGLGSTTVTAVIRDEQGNPIPNANVQFYSDGKAWVSPRYVVSDETGAASTEITNTVPGNVTVGMTTDSVGGMPMGDWPYQVSFVDGCTVSPVAQIAFDVKTATGNRAAFGDGVDSWVGTISATDAQGNPVTGLDPSLWSFWNIDDNSLQISDVTELGDGKYTVVFTSLGGQFMVDARYGTAVSSATLITFVSTNITNIKLSASPESPMAGTSTLVTVTVTDGVGVPMVGADVTFSWDGSAWSRSDLLGDVVDSPTGTTDSSGQFSMHLVDKVPETVTVIATVSSAVGNDWEPLKVTFAPAPPVDMKQSAIEVTNDSFITALIRDANGNPIPAQDVVFTAPEGVTMHTVCPPTYCSVQSRATVSTATDGAASVWLDAPPTSPVEIGVAVMVNGVAVPMPGSPVTLGRTVPLVPDPDQSSVSVSEDHVTVPCQTTIGGVTVTAVVKDARGNPIPDVEVTFSVDPGATAGFSALTGTTDATGRVSTDLSSWHDGVLSVYAKVTSGDTTISLGNPATIVFATECAWPTPSLSLVGDDNTHISDGVDPAIMTVTASDEYGNPMSGLANRFYLVYDTPYHSATIADNGDGTYTIRMVSTAPKNINLSVAYFDGSQNASTSNPVTLHFVDPCSMPGCGAGFSMSATAARGGETVVANGVDSWTWTLMASDPTGKPIDPASLNYRFDVVDEYGNPVDHVHVSAVTDNGDGTASVQFTSTVPGLYLVDIHYGDSVSEGNELGFSAPTAHIESVTVDSWTVCVGDLAWIRAVVLDDFGNPVEGQMVDFAVSNRPDGNYIGGVVTDASGVAAFPTGSSVAADVDVSVSIHGSGDLAHSSSVKFLLGCTDPRGQYLATFEVAPTHGNSSVFADGSDSWTGTVSVKDAQGNPVAGLDPSKFTFAISGGDIAASTVVDHGDGTYTATFTSKTPTADAEVTAALDGGVIEKAQSIPFARSPIDFLRSSMQMINTIVEIPCDGVGQATLAATIRDAQNNPVPGVEVTLTPDDPDAVLSPLPAVTDADGNVSVTVSSKKTGIVQVQGSVKVDGISMPIGGPVGVVFTEGCHAPALNLSAAIDAGPHHADGVDSYSLTVTATDRYNNPMSGLGGGLSLTGDASSLKTTVTDNHDGTYLVRVTSAKTGSFSIGVEWTDGTQTVASDEGPFMVVFDQPSAVHIAAVGMGPAVCAGDYTSFTAFVVDDANNPIQGRNVTFVVSGQGGVYDTLHAVSDAAGQAEVSVTDGLAEAVIVTASLDGSDSVGKSGGVLFLAGCNDPRGPYQMTFGVAPAHEGWDVYANGMDAWTGTIKVSDVYANPVSGLDPTSFDVLVSDPNVKVSPVTDRGDGVYTVSFTSSVPSSDAVVKVAYGERVIGVARPIPFRPIIVEPKETSLSVGESNVTMRCDGTVPQTTVTVEARDAFGNPVAGVDVSFSVDGQATLSNATGVTDETGRSTVTVSSRMSGTFLVRALLHVDGTVVEVGGSPVAVTFVPGCVAPESVVSAQIDGTQRYATGYDAHVVTISARDQFGNPLSGLGDRFVVSSDDQAVHIGDVVDRGNGMYSVEVTSTEPGDFPIRVAVSTDTGSIDVSGSPLTASFLCPLGACWPTISMALTPADGGSSVVADGTDAWTGVVTLTKYRGGQEMITSTGMFQFVVRDSQGTWTDGVSVSDMTINGDGTATVRFTSTVPGDYVVDIQYGDTFSQGNKITFVEQPTPEQLAVSVTSLYSSNSAGVAAVLTVSVRDAHGDPVKWAEGTLSWTGDADTIWSLSDTTVVNPNFTTNDRGEAVVPLLSHTAQTLTATATVGEFSGSLQLTYEQPGTPIQWRSKVEVTGGSVITATIIGDQGYYLPLQDVVFTAPDGVTLKTKCATGTCVVEPGSVVSTLSSGVVSVWADPVPTTPVLVDVAVMIDGTAVPLPGSPVLLGDTSTRIPDEALSSLSLGNDHVTMLCDGSVPQTTVTVVAKDAQGNPVPAAWVLYSVDGGDASLSSPMGVTDGYGRSTVTLSSVKAGTVTVRANLQIGNRTYPLSGSPATVVFVPGCVAPESQVTAQIEGTQRYATGYDAHVVTISARDQFGNPLSGLGDRFVVSSDDQAVHIGDVVDRGNGMYSVEVTSTEPGDFPIRVAVSTDTGSIDVSGSPLTASFLCPLGACWPTISMALTPADGGSSVVADGTDSWTGVVTLTKYRGGQEMITSTGMFRFTVRDGQDKWTDGVSVSDMTINGDGTATVRFTSTVPGDYVVDIQWGDSFSQGNKISFVEQPTPEKMGVSVTASPATVLAGTSSRVTVTVRDSHGNPMSGVRGRFSWTGNATPMGSLGDDVMRGPDFVTDSSGTASIPLLSTTAQTVTVTATVDSFSGTTQITYTQPNKPDLFKSEIEVVDGYAVGAAIRDGEGNLLPMQDVVFTAPDGVVLRTFCAPSSCVVRPGSSVSTLSRGYASVWIDPAPTRAVPISVAVMIDGVAYPLPGSPVMVGQEVQQVPDSEKSSMSVSTDTVTIPCDGSTAQTTATATVMDTQGNPIPGVEVTFGTDNEATVLSASTGVTDSEGRASVNVTSQKAGTVSVYAKAQSGEITIPVGTPATVVFVAGCVAPVPLFDVVIDQGPRRANGADAYTLSMKATDGFGNPLNGIGDKIVVKAGSDVLHVSSLTDHDDGTYTVTVTSTQAGSFPVVVTWSDGSQSVEAHGSPLALVYGGPCAPNECGPNFSMMAKTANGGTSVVADGVDSWTWILKVTDADGKAIDPGLLDYQFRIVDGDGNQAPQVHASAVTDNGDGTGSVQFTSTVAGMYFVDIKYGDRVMTANRLGFSSVSAHLESVRVDSWSLCVGKTANVTATVLDDHGNPVTGQMVDFQINAPNGSRTDSVKTNSVGEAVLPLTSYFAGEVRMQVSLHGSDDLPDGMIVTFLAGCVDPDGTYISSFSVSPAPGHSFVLANGVDSWLGTIGVKDGYGNPIAGVDTSRFTVSITGEGVSATPIVDHGDGTYSAHFTSTVASPDATVKVLFDGAAIDAAQSIPFVAPQPDSDQSSLTPQDSSVILPCASHSGGTAVTVTVKDSLGNPVSGVQIEFSTTGDAILNASTGITDSSGRVVLGVSAQSAGNVSITATMKTASGDIPVGAPVTISFIDEYCSISTIAYVVMDAGQQTSPVTGGQTWFANGSDAYRLTVKVYDKYDNPISGLPVSGFSANALRGTSGFPLPELQLPDGLSVGAWVDNGDGSYTAPVTSTRPGMYQMNVSVSTGPDTALMPFVPVAVQFVSGVVSRPDGTAIADGAVVSSGESVSISAQGFQPRENVTLTIHSKGLLVGSFTADDDGVVLASFTIPPDFESGTHEMSLVGESSGTVNLPFSVQVAAAPSQTPTSEPTDAPTSEPTDTLTPSEEPTPEPSQSPSVSAELTATGDPSGTPSPTNQKPVYLASLGGEKVNSFASWIPLFVLSGIALFAGVRRVVARH